MLGLETLSAALLKARGAVVEVDGVYLKMDRRLSNFMVNVLRTGRHAKQERELILPALSANDVVMELGGGVGHTSIRFAKAIGSERVFTFEANRELEPVMRENFRLNGVRPTAEFCILGDEAGHENFVVHKNFWASSQDPGTKGRQIRVPVRSLNERIRDIDPSFLVVDIEGGERTLFNNIDFHNIEKLMLELHSRQLGKDECERILDLISTAGFRLERQIDNCSLFRRTVGASRGIPPGGATASAGDGIIVGRGSWSFDGMVPKTFDQHVSKSIPGYAKGHQLVLDLAAPRLIDGGRCYELGCSTGTLTAQLAACADPENTTLIGLDQVDGMLDLAKARCSELPHVSFETADIIDYSFQAAQVMVSYYTLQFVPIPDRIDIVQRIFSALEPGGIFLLFEKTRSQDSLQNGEMRKAYHDFKRSQGFSEQEIRAKDEALEGVLIPQTGAENIAMLRTAGFSRVTSVFQELCFQGYLAVK